MEQTEHAPPRGSLAGVLERYAPSLHRLLSNRRQFERVPATGTILATYGRAIPVTLTCSCVDISPRGIGIDSPEPIEANMFVSLRSYEGDPKRWARVRYCRQQEESHRIGLEFIAKGAAPEEYSEM